MNRPIGRYENNPQSSARSEWAFKSRTFVGRIASVNEANGYAMVMVLGVGDSLPANLPLEGLSVTDTSSSWARYMPQAGSYVRCAYGPNGELHVLNYLAFGEFASPDSTQRDGSFTPGIGAYTALANSAKEGQRGLRSFRTLKQGEFDLRSVGGAGYYFTAMGNAVIEGGLNSLTLDKLRAEAVGASDLWSLGGDGSSISIGNVKRALIPGQLPEPVVQLLPGATYPKALEIVVGTGVHPLPTPPTAPAPNIAGKFYDFAAGDVRDALGAPVVGPVALPLRSRARWFDPSGSDVVVPLTVVVDVAGNVKVTQGDTAALGGIDIAGGALSPLSTAFYTQTHEAQTSMALSAQTTMDISGLTGINLNSGGAADVFMVRGDDLKQWLDATLKVWADTHVHPVPALGTSGPAAVPLTAPPPTILSLTGKVK